jgi:hypothetical protein
MTGKAPRMRALWFVLSHPVHWLRLCRWIGFRNAWGLVVRVEETLLIFYG